MTRTNLVLVGSALAGSCCARAIDAGVPTLPACIVLGLWLYFGSWILKGRKRP